MKIASAWGRQHYAMSENFLFIVIHASDQYLIITLEGKSLLGQLLGRYSTWYLHVSSMYTLLIFKKLN